jgi:hypothetical protein
MSAVRINIRPKLLECHLHDMLLFLLIVIAAFVGLRPGPILLFFS